MSVPSSEVVHPAPRPVVLLLHSSAGSARQWQGLIELLQPRFRVYPIEFYGHGERAAWHRDASLTLADEAALALPLLAEAGQAHVVGHSYGAAVALKLATMFPKVVRSVVAYEPVLFSWLRNDFVSGRPAHDIVVVAESIRHRLATNQEHSAARGFIDFWSGAGSWDSLSASRQDAFASRMHAVLGHFDALFREPLQRAQLARLEIPMLFMSGARTVAPTRRIAALLRLALPFASHEVLPRMGHMGPMTHAAEVNRRIVEFLHARALSAPALEPVREVA